MRESYMIVQIHLDTCPNKENNPFSVSACYDCPKHECHVGKNTTFVCKANRTKSAKKAYNNLFACVHAGFPCKVIVDDREGKTE